MESPERGQLLSHCLRETAIRAAELAGGGSSLIFVSLPDGDQAATQPKLRAAAGFGSPDLARQAAAALETKIAQCIESGEPATTTANDSSAGTTESEARLLPLTVDGRVRGALVLWPSHPLSSQAEESLVRLTAGVAVQIDHGEILQELQRLREQAGDRSGDTGQTGDELLKLSETLFAQDIELLRNNEKLGQLEKIKNDFIEKMSRELRTPLNSIIESTIAVLAGENEHLSDAAKRSLRSALDEGTDFQRTLQNILDLWRIKNGEMPLEVQELNFAEVIDEAIFSVQDTLAGRNVMIEKHVAQPLPKIRTDLAKVNQILFLLLDNAAKFTEEGRITISANVNDCVLRCTIEDTGIGICPDDQQYMFDEFFQVDEHSSTRYRGAGLGLSLVRDLLTLLDGSCAIRSGAGEGTTASFEVPIQLV